MSSAMARAELSCSAVSAIVLGRPSVVDSPPTKRPLRRWSHPLLEDEREPLPLRRLGAVDECYSIFRRLLTINPPERVSQARASPARAFLRLRLRIVTSANALSRGRSDWGQVLELSARVVRRRPRPLGTGWALASST